MKKLLLFSLLSLAVALPVSASRGSTRKLDAKFNRADLNDDNLLTFDEFRVTQTSKISLAFVRFRFRNADTSRDGFVDLTEFRASRGGITGGKPSKAELFILADSNRDLVLDITEYAETQRQLMPWRTVVKGFTKRDRDTNDELTPREFGLRRFSF